jgi:3-oxoacyl-[acyl-carrier-protein] synthase-3
VASCSSSVEEAMLRSRILGTGSFLPERVITNFDLEKLVETDDEWIISRTGIRERRAVSEGEACSDMALHAARRAIAAAGIEASQIEMVVVGTVSGDMPFPSTAVLVAHALGLRCCAFDVSAACSGFMHALAMGDNAIRAGTIQKALIIGAEALTTIVNWEDRGTCILFGDGAGAAVLGGAEPGDGGLLGPVHLHSDGSLASALCIPAGGSRTELTPELLAQKQNKVHMTGNVIFKHATRNLAAVGQEALNSAGWTADEVDHVIAHQANLRILDACLKRCGLASDKLFVNLDRYGNTSAASLPIALDEANAQGLLKKGDKLLFLALGGGLVWSGATCTW